METFTSSALGQAYDYAARFSDQVHIVAVAKDFFKHSGLLLCRKSGSNDPFAEVLHDSTQAKQVMADMDSWLDKQ